MRKQLSGLARFWSPNTQIEDSAEVEHEFFASNLVCIRKLAWLTTAINLLTFAATFSLMPKIEAITSDANIGIQILIVRIMLLTVAFLYLFLSRGNSQAEFRSSQNAFGYLFVMLLLWGLALHSGIFQSIKPLITPYLIGLFAVASFTFLPLRVSLCVFFTSWIIAIASQFKFQPDKAILGANLIHLTTMTIIALVVSRVTYIFKMNEILAKIQIKRLSLTDQLTGLANRRLMDDIFRKEWSRCRRDKKPLGVLMADVDFFKSFNDTYGHQAGDECLRQVGQVFKDMARRSGDLAARYGGEEFLMILPDTNLSGTIKIADEIRTAIERLQITNRTGRNKVLTVSLGAASETPSSNGSIQSLIKAADAALYKAKLEGRNRVAFAKDVEL